MRNAVDSGLCSPVGREKIMKRISCSTLEAGEPWDCAHPGSCCGRLCSKTSHIADRVSSELCSLIPESKPDGSGWYVGGAFSTLEGTVRFVATE